MEVLGSVEADLVIGLEPVARGQEVECIAVEGRLEGKEHLWSFHCCQCLGYSPELC